MIKKNLAQCNLIFEIWHPGLYIASIGWGANQLLKPRRHWDFPDWG